VVSLQAASSAHHAAGQEGDLDEVIASLVLSLSISGGGGQQQQRQQQQSRLGALEATLEHAAMLAALTGLGLRSLLGGKAGAGAGAGAEAGAGGTSFVAFARGSSSSLAPWVAAAPWSAEQSRWSSAGLVYTHATHLLHQDLRPRPRDSSNGSGEEEENENEEEDEENGDDEDDDGEGKLRWAWAAAGELKLDSTPLPTSLPRPALVSLSCRAALRLVSGWAVGREGVGTGTLVSELPLDGTLRWALLLHSSSSSFSSFSSLHAASGAGAGAGVGRLAARVLSTVDAGCFRHYLSPLFLELQTQARLALLSVLCLLLGDGALEAGANGSVWGEVCSALQQALSALCCSAAPASSGLSPRQACLFLCRSDRPWLDGDAAAWWGEENWSVRVGALQLSRAVLSLASTLVSVADRAPAAASTASAASSEQQSQGQGQGLFSRAQASLSKDATQAPALRAALNTVERALTAIQPRHEQAGGMEEEEEEEGREALSKGTALRFGAGQVWA